MHDRPQQLSDPVHFSELRAMARSPAHYRAAILEPRQPSAAMSFGTAVHAVVLGQPYSVYDGSRRGKAWEEYEAANECKLILTASEYERAQKCADAINATPHAREVMAGKHEVSREWTVLGRKCAGRVDVLNDWIADLKTCSNGEPATFSRGALRLAYHAQLAWYLDGFGMPDARGLIVAVETSAPYAVTVLELTRKCLDEGRKLTRLWLERLLSCEAANEWPGYVQSIVPLDMPDAESTLIIDGEEVEAA